jgi:hypothetical protein
MMAATAHKFVRRTSLREDEYRKNFRQIDNDVIEFLKSKEAKKVTRQMGTLYLALISAPTRYWERSGVLRFSGAEDDDNAGTCTAWQQLVNLLNCGNTTAKKAIDWMHEQGIIGYSPGKNGIGIRIFLNRAASSIGKREGQKNLRLVPTPAPEARAPEPGTPSKDVLESLDSDKELRTRENIACEPSSSIDKTSNQVSNEVQTAPATPCTPPPKSSLADPTNDLTGPKIVEQIKREVASLVRAISASEHERTRQWFINCALPKAMRIGQRSAYDVLRSYGALSDRSQGGRKQTPSHSREVGKHKPQNVVVRSLNDKEITELAESCVALFMAQGQPIERTISEMMSEAGGFLLQEDAPKVRAKTEIFIRANANTQTERREGDGL